jgi:hypothetical protein
LRLVGTRYKALSLLRQVRVTEGNQRSKIISLSAKTHQLTDNYNLLVYEDYLEQCHLFYSFLPKNPIRQRIFKALYYAVGTLLQRKILT